MQIQTVFDQKRGCGWRKPGGAYLRLDGTGMDCGMFPIYLTSCPCCGEGIKPSWSPRWITAELIQRECSTPGCRGCEPARLDKDEKMLLIFIGTSHYPTPEAFMREARRLGISRRLTNGLPRDFEIGKTWVVLAMKVGETDAKGEVIHRNKAFMIFQPDRVEYVVDPTKLGDEKYQNKLKRLEKKGYTLVQVERRESTQHKMFEL